MAKKKHKVHGMRIRKAHGGYIANHEMPPGADGKMPPEQEHILPDLAALKDHMDHFEPPEEEQPAPQQ